MVLKLSFKPKVEIVIEKVITITSQLRRIVGKKWELTPQVFRWLYTAVIRTKVSDAWWPVEEKIFNTMKLADAWALLG